MRQTLYTPTFNRAQFLPRLYDSIKKQTFKEFIWLIIDDGSTDNTAEVVKQFIHENEIQIQYIYKYNGGKHTADALAWEITKTPYLTSVDSDEELLPHAIKTFEDAWIEIENTGKSEEIAKVSMFCQYKDGSIVGVGDFILDKNIQYWDSTWVEMVYKYHCHRELRNSINILKAKECFNFSDYKWHADTNKFLGEGIIWSKIGRKYKTRLINNIAAIYNTDADNSLLRGIENESQEMMLNKMTNAFYVVEENMDYFGIMTKTLIAQIASFIIMGFRTKTSFHEQFNHITKLRFKILYVIMYIPCIFAYILRIRTY